jgi:hypothetical protein
MLGDLKPEDAFMRGLNLVLARGWRLQGLSSLNLNLIVKIALVKNSLCSCPSLTFCQQ